MKNTLCVYNPYDGSLIQEVEQVGVKQYDEVMKKALSGQEIIQQISSKEKSDILEKASLLVSKEQEKLSYLIASESSKPISQAKKEVQRCANTLKLGASLALRSYGGLLPFDSFDGNTKRVGYYKRVPLGVVFAVTPFNDPLNLVAHKIAPCVVAGNAMILKPSNQTPLCALYLQDLLYKAGLPIESLQVIVSERELTKKILESDDVRMFTFTGGDDAGKQLSQIAGLKVLLMELGGNAPVIVTKDVDIDKTMTLCVDGALSANGQNCISTQRIILHEEIADDFISKAKQKMSIYKIGDPLVESTDIGALITRNAKDRFKKLFDEGKNSQAKVILDYNEEGNCVFPCAIKSQESIFDYQEAFAPFIQFSTFSTLSEAIKMANRPKSMIAAGIFTNNLQESSRAVEELQAASVMVNHSSDYRLDAMPFGGYKYGSLGREGVEFSYMQMTQTKTICFH